MSLLCLCVGPWSQFSEGREGSCFGPQFSGDMPSALWCMSSCKSPDALSFSGWREGRVGVDGW